MLNRFCCCVILLFGLSACTPLSQPKGQILQGRIHWQGEVRLRGDLILDAGAELIIAPGTRIVFEAPRAGEDLYQQHPYFIGSELIVRGRLLARGTETEPILFTSADPERRAGSWGGVNIEDSPQAEFSYCRFEQADSAIHARESRVSVENSVFDNNLVGLRFHDTRLSAKGNLFEHNDTAIRFHLGAPLILQNEIRRNRKGMFISAEPQDYRIENNNFIENRPYQVSLGEGVREPVDLRNNFWSEATGDELEGYFFDGRVDDWLGKILYLPRRLQRTEPGENR